MKICAADWCFLDRSGLSPDAYYRRLAELGLQGVEMVAPEHRAAARASGLALVTACAHDLNHGFNRVDLHDSLQRGIRSSLAEAQRDGIANLILFSGQRGGLGDEDGVRACVTGIGPLAADAERAGVTLLLEVLNEHDHPDQQCSTLAFAARVVRAVGSPRVRILYDLYHGARMGDDVLGFDLGLLPLIGHLHVADTAGRSCPRPGGDPDYRAIVQRLGAAGYEGWWGIEFVPSGEAMAEIASARALLDPATRAAAHSRSR